MNRFGLRVKLTMIVVGVLVIAISAAALMVRQFFYDNVISQKMTTADILTSALVHDLKYDQEAGRTSFDTVIRKYITYYRIITALSYYNAELVNIADADRNNIGRRADNPEIMAAVQRAIPSLKILTLDDERLVIRSIAPVLRGSRIHGAVLMDLSIDDLESTLTAIDRRVEGILLVTVILGAIVLFISLRVTILDRVSRLTAMTREIASGNYAIAIADRNGDELGQLARAFDQMTLDLKTSKEELELYHSKHLEKKVHDATAELKRAYRDLQNAQSQIVLNEKMASLGVLISGIAHELNTPIGAIANVSRNLENQIKVMPRLVSSLRDNSDQAWEHAALFLSDVITTSARLNELPSFQSVRKVEMLLRDNGVQKPREIANTLATFNFLREEELSKHLTCLTNPRLIELAQCVGNISQGTSIAASSCAKIEEIVKALKYYAYTDKGKVEMTDINESVTTALVLLRNKLKYALTVETDWDDDIPAVCCTSEIHQVWTNILNNACDAVSEMGDSHDGRILVRTRREGDGVKIEITDNGIGVPEPLMNNIFDPFFTTKPIGKGTGLGLSIVSGIVKKHRGSIQVDSRKGATTFRIILPESGITKEGAAAKLDPPAGVTIEQPPVSDNSPHREIDPQGAFGHSS
jgi:signal transduction histidine kinase